MAEAASEHLETENNLFLLADISSTVDIRLSCEWINPDNDLQCGRSYSSVDGLLSHIKTTHCTEPGQCLWKFCSVESPNPIQHSCHLLFHGYHSFLKAKGEELLVLKDLSTCQLGNGSVNLFPEVEVGWECHWEYDGSQLCGEVFCCVKSYYEHVRGHVDVKTDSKCHWKGCLFDCTNQWKMTDHIRTHTRERVIACPQCGTMFSNKCKFKDHLDRQVTPSDSRHVCAICHKSFNTDRLLCQHIRGHINTQKCPYCEMTCTSPSALTYHLHYKHTKGKQHHCPICQKEYKTHYSLADHIKIHQDKDIRCDRDGCNYSTNTMRNYRYHIKTEHSDKTVTYCCHVCDQKFPQGKKLTSHLKTVHGFSLPPGHSRFRYIQGQDGLRRLQTVRLIDKNISATSSFTTIN